jgi:uncharacterized protein (TIGR00725 family)
MENHLQSAENSLDFQHRIAVGLMGSAGGEISPPTLDRVRRLGREVARRDWVLITGACPGLPHEAVLAAKAAGGTTVGISPALNFEEHVLKYRSPYECYDAIIYTGSGLMGREIENIRSCDMVVFAGGRSGTLGEFAIAYDEAKLIGVITGTGGIADHIKEIIGFMKKDSGATVLYESEPEALVEALYKVYEKSLLPYMKTIAANRAPGGTMER